MLQIRKAAERGHADHGWLDTYHTFSFADYQDPAFMGFRALRVINDDRVQPGQGFGMHGHRDMEIITYVLEGELEHKDSMGNGEVLRAGELQHMTAGSGVRHSEFNPSPTVPVHLYQIWIVPERRNLPPSYEQKAFAEQEKRGRWRVVASPDGQDGSLVIHQDARIFLSRLESGDKVVQPLAAGRFAWLQVLRGTVQVNDQRLTAGDGVAVAEERAIAVAADDSAEVMLFDLP